MCEKRGWGAVPRIPKDARLWSGETVSQRIRSGTFERGEPLPPALLERIQRNGLADKTMDPKAKRALAKFLGEQAFRPPNVGGSGR